MRMHPHTPIFMLQFLDLKQIFLTIIDFLGDQTLFITLNPIKDPKSKAAVC
jgi:hypothetical protein